MKSNGDKQWYAGVDMAVTGEISIQGYRVPDAGRHKRPSAPHCIHLWLSKGPAHRLASITHRILAMNALYSGADLALSPSEIRKAPLGMSHTNIQRAGHLIRVGSLEPSRQTQLADELTRAGRNLGGHHDVQAALEFEARANAAGISCYTRVWHRGDVGYFTIRYDNYERVMPSDVPAP